MTMKLGARSFVLGALMACGGSIEHPDSSQQRSQAGGDPAQDPPPAASSSSSSTAPAKPPPAVTPTPVPGSCEDAPGKRIFHTSLAEVHAAFQGRWLRCSELGLTHEKQDGIEFVGDRWHLLRRDASGALQPVYGVMNEGALEMVDGGAMNPPQTFFVNFNYDRGGTVISLPVFSSPPDGLLINNNGVYEYRYVRAPAP